MHLSQTPQLGHSHIHLVDCVPSILASLHARFSGALNQKLTFTLADAGTIEFMHRGPQAIIVAGVGGRTVVEILQALLARGLPHSLTKAGFTDFFISPNSDAFELRRYLKANNFAILKEEFVSENGFHHEHLQLRHGALDDQNTRVIEHTDAGHALWLSLDNDKKKYLNKLLKHHQLSYQFKHLELDREAANAYQQILARASTCAYSQ
jgi:tRNA A22 N-methylase